TLSIGVAAYPGDGKDRQSLVRAADMALYASKRLGRNRVMSYVPDLDTASSAKTTRGKGPEDQLLALERSLERGSFEFVYQPIVEGTSWRIFGYEALCRPAEEVFANVTELISTAERAGKVTVLGRIMRACAVQPLDDLAEGFHLFINLHQHEIYDPALVEADSMRLPWAHRTVLELPEAAVLRDLERVRRTVGQLKDLGFKIALAEIGATYGTLEVMTSLEVDFVKLSRRLLSGASSELRTERLLRHILDFAIGEGIQPIAEGIETLEQLRQVQNLKCPLFQGFLFGKGEPPFAAASIPPTANAGRGKASSTSKGAKTPKRAT
ncbi:MAG: GGDEF domain-containing phosphodiesterase, partial [Myxococcota bacterium]